jgi:ATP-dependent exoDNAse (exonuclease V) beta subunit
VARLRGEISHRLLETLSQGGRLPEAAAVASALEPATAASEAALDLAEDILTEIQACRDDPFLAPLLASNLPVARSEWLLESWSGAGVLYRGQIDRLVFDGQQWWLIDYKTSRPAAGLEWDDFIASEANKYRPQLLAYREMAAKFFDLPDPEIIQAFLYFTGCRRPVRIE